jgi:hypothetical protein
MPFIGNKPSAVPLTSADIADGIITSAKIVDGTIVNADINASAAIAGTKISGSFGKLLQAITAIDTTTRSTTSTSYVTGSNTLSISITPSSVSSRIFIIASFTYYASNEGLFTFFRNSTNLATDSTVSLSFFKGVSYGGFDSMQNNMSFLDSPATTSATTYQVYFKRGASGTAYINNGSQGVITAFEIGA